MLNNINRANKFKTELFAAIITFFTCSYITIVNSVLLQEAGMPLNWTIIATTIVCAVSCVIIGLYAKVPLIIIPGVGETIFFTFTIVKSHGFNYHEGLAVVLVSGLIFMIISLTPFAKLLNSAIPKVLKDGITIGIGLFMAFVGLQNSNIIVSSNQTLISLGEWNINTTISLLILLLALVLFALKVPLSFLITIILGSIIAFISKIASFSSDYSIIKFEALSNNNTALSFSFDKIGDLSFWSLVFSLTILIVFQNLGTINGFGISNTKKFARSFKSVGASNIISSLLGISSTVVAVESATSIHSGSKDGRSSVFVGIMFLVSLLFLPLIISIPSIALSPILIIIGGLMLMNIQNIEFNDMTDYIPCYITIIMIPLTFDIATGMGFGFISYVVINLVCGNIKKLNIPLIAIAILFILSYVFH